jgi:membrane peptidoglycan carboxypeptidase
VASTLVTPSPRRYVAPPPPRIRRPAPTRPTCAERRIRFVALTALASLLTSVAALGVSYAVVRVPMPPAKATSRTSIVYFSDGRTEMARLSVENRVQVTLDRVPVHVRNAVVAAEDRSFFTNNGVSPTGIARAVWVNVRGEDVQGGSTITQQYVKNAVLSQERTFSRKMREVLYAVKADRTYTKDEILELYLNTIAFGRGAYGIEAAAQTYFGRSVADLGPAEGAVLAANIKAPSYYDPVLNPGPSKSRWRYVLDGMVAMGTLDRSEAAALAYPRVRRDNLAGGTGSRNLGTDVGHVVNRVIAELGRAGIGETELRTGGYAITTTIDGRAQRAARGAVTRRFPPSSPDRGAALVAVEPGTGKVRAYYGGAKGYEFDVAGAAHPAGATVTGVAERSGAPSRDGVSVLDAANAMAALAAGGDGEPSFVESVTRAGEEPRYALEPGTRRTIGTATGWRAGWGSGAVRFDDPASTDAWTVGLTGELAAAVWVGRTDGAALPGEVWTAFTDGVEPRPQAR